MSGGTSPESDHLAERHLSLLYLVLLCGYAAWIIICSFGTPTDKFDDMIPLVHGLFVRHGHTPNIDFYSFYPPLNLYVDAFLFRLAGETVLIVRAFNAGLFVIVLL